MARRLTSSAALDRAATIDPMTDVPDALDAWEHDAPPQWRNLLLARAVNSRNLARPGAQP
jgi:hypothetical protein